MGNKMDLKAARERGKEAARGVKNNGKPKPEGGMRPVLMEYVKQRGQMHKLAQKGNEEAAKQEAFLDGFLSQWD
jgi:hypothetical protein